MFTYDGHTGVSQSVIVASTQLLQVGEGVPASWWVVCKRHDVWMLRVVVLLGPECKAPFHNSLQQGRSMELYHRGLVSRQALAMCLQQHVKQAAVLHKPTCNLIESNQIKVSHLHLSST